LEIVLFTYDRPHWKTERFIHELASLQLLPTWVVAAPWKNLTLPPAAVTTVTHLPRHPAELSQRYGIEYVVRAHEEWDTDSGLGIIGGGRIIPADTISKFSVGILNMHPGLIPLNRGLSNVCRAIRDGMPQAITAHLIDSRVDAGRILLSQTVPTGPTDTIYDVGERMMDTQVAMLGPAIRLAGLAGSIPPLPDGVGGYEPPLSKAEEERLIEVWSSRCRSTQ